MNKYRTEQDTMGEVIVPADALYGAQTQRALDNFGHDKRLMHSTFIKSLAMIKCAAAQANSHLACLDDAIALNIKSACMKIIAEDLNGQSLADAFPVSVFQTGSGTSTNMNINEVIANLVKLETGRQISTNDDVNYGQSSNDVIPSAIQVSACLELKQRLMPALTILCDQLNTLAQKYQNVVKTGRTHLMDAMPLSLGDEIATWRHQFIEARSRIEQSLPALRQLPLGGTAIGTGINRHKDYPQQVCSDLNEITQDEFQVCENLASRISAQDPSLEMHGQLKVLATVLIKIVNDIRWMNSGPNAGLAELKVKALQPGSSIMPAKVNPVIAESIIMQATEVIANDTKITLANQSGNFQLNVMLPLIADAMLTSIDLLSDAVTAMSDKLLVSLEINDKKLAASAAQNPILVTALNTRIGYTLAAKIAKQAQEQQRPIKEVAYEITDLTKEELEQLLDPKKLAKPFS